MLQDALQEYVNFGGETVEFPREMICIVSPNGIQIKIYGIDVADCRETFERKKETFSRIINDFEMYTPRLVEYRRKKRAEIC